MVSEESLVHQGHRQRMKAKLLTHGARIFDTYELLEMLLYQVIPYKDTNPIAKRLLSEFGSLSGVLSADKNELMRVSGIGERAAELLILAGRFHDMHALSVSLDRTPVFDSYELAGKYLVDYFESNPEHKIGVMLLDNSMRLIATERINAPHFGSAAVQPKLFIDAVTRTGAGIIILAAQHRYGPLYPTDPEMQTNKLLKLELSKIGIEVAEFYVISGKKFIGIGERIGAALCSVSPELERFYQSIENNRGKGVLGE